MYHSITFGDGSVYPYGHEKMGQFRGLNTWDDWHLIPAERPSIASPGVSTNFVEIPGRNGAIDMSEYLTGGPVYGTRQGSFDFYVANDHEYWETIRAKMMNAIHGKRMKICLEDDPSWYWEGRFSVQNWRSEATNSRVSINYQLEPYKRKTRSEGNLPVIWDEFCFETDYDYYPELYNIALTTASGPYTATIYSNDYSFPIYVDTTISSGNSLSFTLNGGTPVVLTGNATHHEIGSSASGENTISVSGTGTFTVYFREGSL